MAAWRLLLGTDLGGSVGREAGTGTEMSSPTEQQEQQAPASVSPGATEGS